MIIIMLECKKNAPSHAVDIKSGEFSRNRNDSTVHGSVPLTRVIARNE
jgi:hypothetical protein